MSLFSCVWRLSVAPLAGVERQGRESMGSGGLAVGISHSLPLDPHLIRGTHPLPFVQSLVHQGQGLGGGSPVVIGEGSDRACSSSVSRLLQPAVCGDEGLGVVEAGHRPFVTESEGSEDFKMETLQSVLLSVRAGDWMVSLDLKDAYLQVPMHPDSRKFLRFVAFGKVYQFKVLCFGLSMAPQVFKREAWSCVPTAAARPTP